MPTPAPNSKTSSWPRSRAGDRQSVADIGQVIFEIAVFVGLRIERHATGLHIAGDETPADGAHAAPFRAVDRHRIEDAERGRQDLGADPLARVLHMAARAGEIELAAARGEILLAVFAR